MDQEESAAQGSSWAWHKLWPHNCQSCSMCKSPERVVCCANPHSVHNIVYMPRVCWDRCVFLKTVTHSLKVESTILAKGCSYLSSAANQITALSSVLIGWDCLWLCPCLVAHGRGQDGEGILEVFWSAHTEQTARRLWGAILIYQKTSHTLIG